MDYTDLNGDTRVERYQVSADSNVADTASHHLVLFVAQPYPNHNGGLVMFGPDGMLYIGMGDGGSGGDPQNRAQNPDSLLGKLLRIDVDGGDPYVNPPNNPYAGGGGRGEIWAIGLRNPWRFAFLRSHCWPALHRGRGTERMGRSGRRAQDPGRLELRLADHGGRALL